MSFRQPKQKPCPAALCLYMMGSIPDRSVANPDVDLNPDDESLADRDFTDVNDGSSEDALIAAIDGNSGESDDELLAGATDDADEDDLDIIEDEDDAAAISGDEAILISGIEQSPWERLSDDPANREVRIGEARPLAEHLDEAQLLPNRIGSRRAASLSADDDANPRRAVVTWKDAVKVPAQHLRHTRRPRRHDADGADSDSD